MYVNLLADSDSSGLESALTSHGFPEGTQCPQGSASCLQVRVATSVAQDSLRIKLHWMKSPRAVETCPGSVFKKCPLPFYFLPFFLPSFPFLPSSLWEEDNGKGRRRGRERMSSKLHAQVQSPRWGLISRPWDPDLSWSQESEAWPIEPPRRPIILSFLKEIILFLFGLFCNALF